MYSCEAKDKRSSLDPSSPEERTRFAITFDPVPSPNRPKNIRETPDVDLVIRVFVALALSLRSLS